MPAESAAVSILLWTLAVLAAWFIFVEVIIRVVRHYIHFPIPSFLASLINNPIRRQIQPPPKVVEWAGIEPGSVVLEVGPGTGTFTAEAARRVTGRGRILAAEIQPTLALKLRNRLQRNGIMNVAPVIASAHALPFTDCAFDCVFMITVLAEIPDKERALLEIRRALKATGRLAIGEFLLDPDYPLRKTVIRWCRSAGLEPVQERHGLMHYVLTFRADAAEN